MNPSSRCAKYSKGISADRFTWESSNRTLDGDPLPGIGRIEINRVKK